MFMVDATRLMPVVHIKDIFIPLENDPEPLGTFWILTATHLHQMFAPPDLNQQAMILFHEGWNDIRITLWLTCPERRILITPDEVIVLLPSITNIPQFGITIKRPDEIAAIYGYNYRVPAPA